MINRSGLRHLAAITARRRCPRSRRSRAHAGEEFRKQHGDQGVMPDDEHAESFHQPTVGTETVRMQESSPGPQIETQIITKTQ